MATKIVAVFLMLVAGFAHAQSVPYTQNFDAAGDWSALIAVESVCSEAQRGQTTHVTAGCYSGGCAKLVPANAPCTGGGINGGVVGLDFELSGLTRVMHVRFLTKFGSTLRDNIANGGGGLLNKFVNLWAGGVRQGILKTQNTITSEDPRGLFMSLAIEGAAGYIFESPPSRGWIQDTDLLIDLGSTNNLTTADSSGNTWLSIEYMIDQNTNHTEMWVYDRNGLIQNIADTRSTSGINFNRLQLGGYWNAYVVADPNAYLLIDNLQVSTSYIGPPAGFVGSGGDTTPPTVSITGPTSSATYSTASTTVNISGTASDNVGVTNVTWSNDRGGSGTATGTTSWSQNSVLLYLGSNVLTVRAYDAAGLYSEDTLTVTLSDSTAPTVTIQTSSPQTVSSDSLQVSFTSDDNIAVTETRWRIGAQPNGSTGTVSASPASTSGYSVGANTLWIGARDASGNWGYNSITVNYTPASDGVSPTVSITTSKPAEIVADSMTLTWTDSDNVGVTERRWLVDAQPTASVGTIATSPATVSALRVGTQTVWVGVRDAAGNWAYDSIQVTRNYGAARKGVVLSGGGSF